MKKFFYLCLLALPFLFIGCSDDEVSTPDSLTGTTWVWTLSMNDEQSCDTIRFVTETLMTGSFSYKDNETGEFSYTRNGTYTYSKPNVTLNDEGEVSAGKVDGNKMTFKESQDGETYDIVYYKK